MGVDNIGTVTPPTRTGMTLRALVKTPVVVLSRDGILHADEPRASSAATGTRSSSLTSANASVGVSILLKAAAGPVDPKIDLNWTATPDTYATGYEIIRTGGPTTSVPGRTTDQRADLLTAAQFPTAPGLADAVCVGWCSTVIGSFAGNESIALEAHVTGDTGL